MRQRLVRAKQRVRRTWFALRRIAATDHRLPSFIIIGAQRAGTTSLFNALAQHPMISPSVVKEVHYFDFRYHRGERWYRSHFPMLPGRRYHEGHQWGEASPFYLFDPFVPARVRALLPDVKLIALLRNPIDRAYSDHQFETKLGHESLPFQEALEREEERLALDDPARLSDPRYLYHSHRRRHAYVARGLYAEQVARWQATFGNDRLLVLPSEDFFLDMAGTVAAVTDFLGLPRHQVRGLKSYNAVRYAPMEDATRDWLRDRFQDDVPRLRELTGLTFSWDIS